VYFLLKNSGFIFIYLLLFELDSANHGLATYKVLQDDEYLKVLEIFWNLKLDIFQFRNPNASNEPFSIIAKFFDSLGSKILDRTTLVSIVYYISPKFLCSDCDPFNAGENEIHSQLLDCWFDYHQLQFLNAISIPRWILLTDLVLYNAPFMGFPTHRLRLSLPQCISVPLI